MTVRTNDAAVRLILPSTTVVDLTAFILAASLMVDKVAASTCGSALTATELLNIESWLAAHLVRAEDPQVGRFKFEQSEKTYQIGNRQLFGIMSDIYGQTANSLSGGCLADLDKRKYSLRALGGAEI